MFETESSITNYKTQSQIIVSSKKTTLFCTIIFLISFIALKASYEYIYGIKPTNEFNLINFIWLGILLLAHELLHCIGYYVLGKASLKDIKIGIEMKSFTAYATCLKPLKVSDYRIISLLPGIVFGLLPLIIAFTLGNYNWSFIGLLMTICSIGDFIIVYLLKELSNDTLILDWAYNVGFTILQK